MKHRWSCWLCSLYTAESFCWKQAIPHSGSTSEDALNSAPVEGAHDGGLDSGSLQFAEEVEVCLSLLGQWCGVSSPGEVHVSEDLMSSPSIQQNRWWSVGVAVVRTPLDQLAHLACVVGLIDVGDKTTTVVSCTNLINFKIKKCWAIVWNPTSSRLPFGALAALKEWVAIQHAKVQTQKYGGSMKPSFTLLEFKAHGSAFLVKKKQQQHKKSFCCFQFHRNPCKVCEKEKDG